MKRSFKSAWDSIRHNVNYIAAAVLIVVGVVADFYAPGSGSWFYAAAGALIESPVQLGYSSDGPYVIVGYGGFGVETKPLGGGATSRPPPMTPPPGAVSLTMTGVVDSVKKWFGMSPSLPEIFIDFDNVWDRKAKDHQGRPLYDKVDTALTVAMTHLAGSLPPLPNGVRATVSEGGSGSTLAHGYYSKGAGVVRFVGAHVKFVSNQTELNSLALHELLHVIDTYGVPRSAWGEKIADWHKRIYRAQWDLRDDPRFYLDPKGDMYNNVYRQCVSFGGGCTR